MKGESGNAKCYAVKLCEKWEILIKVITMWLECQIHNPNLPNGKIGSNLRSINLRLSLNRLINNLGSMFTRPKPKLRSRPLSNPVK
jgi:hypothetical protein